MPRNQDVANGPIARVGGIDQAIAFNCVSQCQLHWRTSFRLSRLAYQLSKPTKAGCKPRWAALANMAEMIVSLGQVIAGVVEPKVARQMRGTIRPQQADQVDALHHWPMLAGPMPRDQFHGPGIRLVERGNRQSPACLCGAHARPDFRPQRRTIRLTALQQTRVGVMRRSITGSRRMRLGGFDVAEDSLRRNQKVNVVEFVALGWVHAPSVPGLR